MKKLLLFILLFIGCDADIIKYNTIYPNIKEGTIVGYSIEECIYYMESFCIEKEGEYYYIPDINTKYMCSCNWGSDNN